MTIIINKKRKTLKFENFEELKKQMVISEKLEENEKKFLPKKNHRVDPNEELNK